MPEQSFGDQKINSIRENLIFLLRYRLNDFIGTSGANSSQLIASIVWQTLSFVACFFIFLFINILLGVYLSSFWSGSLLAGFACVLLGYTTFLLLLMLFRKQIENAIRQKLSAQVVQVKEKLNDKLNAMPQMKVSSTPNVPFKDIEPSLKPHEALLKSNEHNRRQAELTQARLKEDLLYAKDNYKKIAFTIATDRVEKKVPMGHYIASIMHFIEPSEAKPKAEKKPSRWAKILPKQLKSEKANEQRTNFVRTVRPYLPYLSLLFKVAGPVLSSFAISKSQSLLLRKLLKKKKK